jgi:hypothetical protein
MVKPSICGKYPDDNKVYPVYKNNLLTKYCHNITGSEVCNKKMTQA